MECFTLSAVVVLPTLDSAVPPGKSAVWPGDPAARVDFPPRSPGPSYLRLKNWTARSCFSAEARVGNVPRFLRFPVRGSSLRE